MSDSSVWPWAALALLGAYHGVNPGMGWLFAVALGMQERSRTAVCYALVPIAIGHFLAVGTVVLGGALLHRLLPLNSVKWIVAAALIAFGLYRLIRSRHPRWVGMRVGFSGLTLWSFLMASAHGSGLMLLPVLLNAPAMSGNHSRHMLQLMSLGSPILYTAGTAIHTLAYFATTLAVALLVYEKFGLALLRSAWINLDFVWSLSLLVTGVAALFL